MLILETRRLALREFLPDDLDALAKVLSDAETMRFYPAPLDRTGVADWIERNRRRCEKDGFGLWARKLKSDTTCAKTCGGRGWPPKRHRRAATTVSVPFPWTDWSRSSGQKISHP